MKQEFDGMVGTEWQVADFTILTFEEIGNDIPERNEMFKWVLTYQGVGRYYVDGIFGMYYFECDEDRVMFTLRWAK